MFRSRLGLLLVACLFTVTLLSVPTARAEEIPRAWIGGLYGISVPNAAGTTARGMFGFSAGAKLGTEWGLGAYYMNSQKSESGTNFDYALYGVQFGYHFEGEANGVFVAGRIGTSKVDSGTTSVSPMNLGVVGGYDYMFTDHLSIGGEVNFMSISQASPINAFTTLDFLGAVKIWF